MYLEFSITPEGADFFKRVGEALKMENADLDSCEKIYELLLYFGSNEKFMLDLPRKIKSLEHLLETCSFESSTRNKETSAVYNNLFVSFLKLIKERKLYSIKKSGYISKQCPRR